MQLEKSGGCREQEGFHHHESLDFMFRPNKSTVFNPNKCKVTHPRNRLESRCCNHAHGNLVRPQRGQRGVDRSCPCGGHRAPPPVVTTPTVWKLLELTSEVPTEGTWVLDASGTPEATAPTGAGTLGARARLHLQR